MATASGAEARREADEQEFEEPALPRGQMVVEGVKFVWTLEPADALVRVRHPIFGMKAGRADGNPEETAWVLAKRILDEY
jgi:hypothetical protein